MPLGDTDPERYRSQLVELEGEDTITQRRHLLHPSGVVEASQNIADNSSLLERASLLGVKMPRVKQLGRETGSEPTDAKQRDVGLGRPSELTPDRARPEQGADRFGRIDDRGSMQVGVAALESLGEPSHDLMPRILRHHLETASQLDSLNIDALLGSDTADDRTQRASPRHPQAHPIAQMIGQPLGGESRDRSEAVLVRACDDGLAQPKTGPEQRLDVIISLRRSADIDAHDASSSGRGEHPRDVGPCRTDLASNLLLTLVLEVVTTSDVH